MFFIKLEKENSIVTDYYLKTIGEAFKENDEVVYSYDWENLKPNKNDIVIVSTATNALKMIIKRKKYYFWAQGIWPEESNMRHNSKIRFKMCSFIEKLALKKAKYVFMVSNTMKDPYIFEFIELKMDEFIPEYGSKIAFYLQALDEQIKDETDNPSIGIILCPNKNNKIVDYTLKYINKPVGVSEYKILDKLSIDYMKNLLTEEEKNSNIGINVK